MLAFAEACVGIGIFISGAFLVIVSSLLFFNEVASLQTICLLAMTGALLGDHIGFYVGHFVGPKLHASQFAQRT
jgi:membrane-associated protein